ncbi:MAG: hypothetical protein A2381_18975 [Bdellovibrionales bacterium RIFOXYB1_FULL_37_110]|nr:MAG: hypothetical protein A2181_05285 [Bdellovibrionales bacterium RIFOXYA1_FULL_38_20]OFZ46588.1 MAG: hypothetical protein A2417_13980 [Bdellovibrionales bacterium RIFOXYC1_FULL_37_79]OFZ57710.1 MAG: hypothetical protein A2381_18975 [Bdellovibrionales bacterium RIFOXYB1_FULL_37_110]OFZ62966.1 MAG: hypothetical protein A2577_11630 [Bdellovibrionales bacterium RIFOXYD1_FULL_36_51]
MKQDKFIFFIQLFFRILAWTTIPGLLVWVYFSISLTTSSHSILLEKLFQNQHLGAMPPVIPTTLILICITLSLGGMIGFFQYHAIASLIKKIRHDGITVHTLMFLKKLSYFFIIAFVLDLTLFSVIRFDFHDLEIFLKSMTLIRPVIDWYHFIYVEFTGISNLAIFFIIRFLIRFMEYHLNIRKNIDELVKEQELVI